MATVYGPPLAAVNATKVTVPPPLGKNSFLERSPMGHVRRATYRAARLASHHPFGHASADVLWFTMVRAIGTSSPTSARASTGTYRSARSPPLVGAHAVRPASAPAVSSLDDGVGWRASPTRGTAAVAAPLIGILGMVSMPVTVAAHADARRRRGSSAAEIQRRFRAARKSALDYLKGEA
jgi:hypothetical protein